MEDAARRIHNLFRVMYQVKDIFNISNEKDFSRECLRIFRYQGRENPVFSSWIEEVGVDIESVDTIEKIPFLPVEFFKTHDVVSGSFIPEVVFCSSGTSGMERSRHLVRDSRLYRTSFQSSFREFYGNPSDYHILGLLPSYLERDGSSLVYMVDYLIKKSLTAGNGFYLDNQEKLAHDIREILRKDEKVFLIGVSFALIDFAEQYEIDLSGSIVMETGGMKGRRKEITRNELHNFLKNRFNLENIHSEYGMTELLTQAYSYGDGLFRCPPWMKILIRDTLDPFSLQTFGKTGGVNIVDLANIHSCSFIETKDLGILHEDCSFELSGRFDNSDIRGCNLLVLD